MACEWGSWVNWRAGFQGALLCDWDGCSKSIALVDFVLISHGTCVFFLQKVVFELQCGRLFNFHFCAT